MFERWDGVERRQNPRPDTGARYSRLRREIEPSESLTLALEHLVDAIKRLERGVAAALATTRAPSRVRRKASSAP
jgi:hypothetical protein